AVTDNGISYDSVQFAQSLSAPEDPLHLIGPSHRKVHAIQNAGDTGTTCDAPLSGGGTHGNVVAGVIAGDASSLGVFLTKHSTNVRPRFDNLQMDGVARGARIIMQDAATPDKCTLNDLVERGGNVTPGSLAIQLARAICPKTPATAKDLVSVGSHYDDVQTNGGSNLEESPTNFTSKGPATAGSLRMAPMILGVGADVTGFFNAPNTASMAVWRSRDNDNSSPVE